MKERAPGGWKSNDDGNIISHQFRMGHFIAFRIFVGCLHNVFEWKPDPVSYTHIVHISVW